MKTDTGKAEQLLSKLGKEIDSLLNKVKESQAYQDIDLDSRAKEVKNDFESLSSSFQKFKKDNQQTFKDVESSVKESLNDIQDIFKSKKSKSTL